MLRLVQQLQPSGLGVDVPHLIRDRHRLVLLALVEQALRCVQQSSRVRRLQILRTFERLIGAPLKPRALKGERVLVTGAGPIGLGTALFARIQGADVHLLDLSEARLRQAGEKFGFEKQHLAGTDLLTGPLSDGFDVIFDATGSAGAIEAGFPHVFVRSLAVNLRTRGSAAGATVELDLYYQPGEPS